MKALVVYFSLTGNTKRIAEFLASEIPADIEDIKDSVKRTGIFGYLQTVREAVFSHVVPILPSAHNPDRYDLIILGTPVWGWSLSSPVRSYINAHYSKFRNVAFFCTEGGAGGAGVFRQMEKSCGKQPVASLEITESDMKNGNDKEKIRNFIQSISQFANKD